MKVEQLLRNDGITEAEIEFIILEAFDHATGNLTEETKELTLKIARACFGKEEISLQSPAFCTMTGFIMGLEEGLRIAAVRAEDTDLIKFFD